MNAVAMRMAMLVILLLGSSHSLLAQNCPPGWIDKGGFSFTMVLTPPAVAVNCTTVVTISYCVPGPGITPKEQVSIYDLRMEPPCTIQNEGQMMQQIVAEFMRRNNAQFPCPPCPGMIQWSISWAACMNYYDFGPGARGWRSCPEVGPCITGWHICCDSQTGEKQIHYIGTVNSDDCPGQGILTCTAFCPNQ